MKRTFHPEVVVLGAGPVGIVAALEFSKHQRTTLIASQFPSGSETPTVEAVPAALLALLLEFGIHPRHLMVEELYRSRVVAWEQEGGVKISGPTEAHVERPALDLALFRALVESGRVIFKVGDPSCVKAAIAAARNKEIRLIDATGRRAVSARRKVHLIRPFAARTFLIARSSSPADGSLRIAALPGGFVYRLGGANHLLLGIAGRKETIVGDCAVLEERIYQCQAGWILDRTPLLSEWVPGRISAASVQWTIEDAATTIGDAALARDTLSSQGLATGISEALHAAASESTADQHLLNLRKIEQRSSHLRSVASLIGRCRFREERAWQDYEEFLQHHAEWSKNWKALKRRDVRLSQSPAAVSPQVSPG